MGHLIGVDLVQMLQGGAGMVDLIEIGRVHIGGLGGPLLPLVEQGLGPFVHLSGRHGPHPIPQRQLRQPQPLSPGGVGRGEAEAGSGDGAHRLLSLVLCVDLLAVPIHLVQLQHLPFEQAVIGLIQPDALPVPILVLPLQRVVPGAQGGVEGQLGHGLRPIVGESHAVPLLELRTALGPGQIAQHEKRGARIYRRDEHDRQDVPPLHGVAGQGEGHAPGLGPLFRHGDPLQAVGPGPKAHPIIHEKSGAYRYPQDRPGKGGGQVPKEPRHAVHHRVPRPLEGERGG